MRQNEDKEIEALVQAWTVDTVDLTDRVRAALKPADPTSDLIAAIQALRAEVADLRRTSESLQDEVFRLRMEIRAPAAPKATRFAPYSPPDSLVRLS